MMCAYNVYVTGRKAVLINFFSRWLLRLRPAQYSLLVDHGEFYHHTVRGEQFSARGQLLQNSSAKAFRLRLVQKPFKGRPASITMTIELADMKRAVRPFVRFQRDLSALPTEALAVDVPSGAEKYLAHLHNAQMVRSYGEIAHDAGGSGHHVGLFMLWDGERHWLLFHTGAGDWLKFPTGFVDMLLMLLSRSQ